MAALVLLRTIGNDLSVTLHGERPCEAVRLAFLVGLRGVVIAGAYSSLSGVAGGSVALFVQQYACQSAPHPPWVRQPILAYYFLLTLFAFSDFP